MFLGHRRIYLLCYYCFNAGLPDLKTADFSLAIVRYFKGGDAVK